MEVTQLVQIRRDFYQNIRKKVESIIGVESKDLKKYRHEFEKEISAFKSIQILDKKHLFNRIKSSQIILVGDFHAQKQSTRALLRLVRPLKSNFCIAVECICSRDQMFLDQFLSGELSEKDFLTKISWKKTWQFPWENYRPLFRWAQQNKIKIWALNAPPEVKSLKKRDQFAAKEISKILKSQKGKPIFIQFGDLHLAKGHLPKEIRKINSSLNQCRIFQSPETLYFKIMEMQKELTADVVKLNYDTWALNSLAPWIKWQDYLLFLESGYDKKLAKQEFDATDTVAHTVDFVAKIFSLKIDTAALSVYSYMDNKFFDLLEEVPLSLKKRVIENVEEGLSFYIPEIQIGYLSRYSVNQVARVAAEYIYYKTNGYNKTILDPKREFLRLIWLEAVIYFLSKCKNPKRKTDTLHDLRVALQKEQYDDRGKDALVLSISQKLNELQFLASGRVRLLDKSLSVKFGRKSYFLAAQILGGMLGEKLFYGFNKKLFKLPQNKELVFKNLQSPYFSKIYYESLELLESWPNSFKSKYDKL